MSTSNTSRLLSTRLISTGLAGVLLAAAAASTWAQSAQPAVVVERQRLSVAEHAAMRGTYELGDGRALVLGGSLHRPTAQLGDATSVALLRTGEHTFESADGQMRIALRAQPNGSIHALTLQTGAQSMVAMR
ncbi:hypothetical protein IP84_03755 [beta proteobacterium AAP99]|nr:hypothetical protein IP84_03755 [beta proteobacterium AAP99]